MIDIDRTPEAHLAGGGATAGGADAAAHVAEVGREAQPTSAIERAARLAARLEPSELLRAEVADLERQAEDVAARLLDARERLAQAETAAEDEVANLSKEELVALLRAVTREIGVGALSRPTEAPTAPVAAPETASAQSPRPEPVREASETPADRRAAAHEALAEEFGYSNFLKGFDLGFAQKPGEPDADVGTKGWRKHGYLAGRRTAREKAVPDRLRSFYVQLTQMDRQPIPAVLEFMRDEIAEELRVAEASSLGAAGPSEVLEGEVIPPGRDRTGDEGGGAETVAHATATRDEAPTAQDETSTAPGEAPTVGLAPDHGAAADDRPDEDAPSLIRSSPEDRRDPSAPEGEDGDEADEPAAGDDRGDDLHAYRRPDADDLVEA